MSGREGAKDGSGRARESTSSCASEEHGRVDGEKSKRAEVEARKTPRRGEREAGAYIECKQVLGNGGEEVRVVKISLRNVLGQCTSNQAASRRLAAASQPLNLLPITA